MSGLGLRRDPEEQATSDRTVARLGEADTVLPTAGELSTRELRPPT